MSKQTDKPKEDEKKSVIVRMQPELYTEVKEIADKETRSVNNQIIAFIKHGVEQYKGK